MRLFALLPLLTLAATVSLSAQHCPFDNMAILVIRITDLDTGVRVQDATISLCDSEGNVLNDWQGRPLFFVPNPEESDPEWMEELHFERIRYSFAADYYILPISWNWAEETIFAEVRCSNPDAPVISISRWSAVIFLTCTIMWVTGQSSPKPARVRRFCLIT